MTHAAYHPFASESLGNGHHGCATCSLIYVFICWVPQIKLTLTQVHKWGHFLWSQRLKTFMLSSKCCCPSFFLFHRRALRFQAIRRKVHWTRRIVPRACCVECFGLWTQLHRSSSNCQNQVHEAKVCLIKNELSLPNFFQVRRTPQARFANAKVCPVKHRLNLFHKLWRMRREKLPSSSSLSYLPGLLLNRYCETISSILLFCTHHNPQELFSTKENR